MSNSPFKQPDADSERDRVKKLRDTWAELGEAEFRQPGLAGLPPLPGKATSAPAFSATAVQAPGIETRPEESSAVIVEHYTPFGELLGKLCKDDAGFSTVTRVRDIKAAANAVRFENPFLVLLDGSFMDQEFATAAQEIRRQSPQSRIVFISHHCDRQSIDAALRLRFEAFVDKNTNSISHLKDAIQSVAENRQWFPPAFWRAYSSHLQPAQVETPLTPSEEEILTLMKARFPEHEIANKLQIPANRISAYRHNVSQRIETAPIAQIEPFVEILMRWNRYGSA